MESEKLEKKFINAAKWSTITETIAKIAIPVTNMILARIISPEAFGVVASVTMIVSFVEMFSDAGFQKYLVQHEFNSNDEKYKCANVAFFTHLGLASSLWIVIILLRDQIAALVGNPGLGNVITFACFQLILTSFSSIQIALYKRDLDFKTIFLARMIAICIPFTVTIPLALLGFSYWALIIGTVTTQISNAIVLTLKSKWKPKLYYKFETLKEMLSFSIWSLVEAISIWFTTWIDVFIIGSYLNQYYLGIYKTSTSMVNSLMALVTASIVPVLFSTLSRLQNDSEKFNKFYFYTQRLVSTLIFPLGIGVFLYSGLATKILLGSKWDEASNVIGIWALTSSIMITFGYLCSEVYRAKGKPRLSFYAQLLHLIVLVPVCIIGSKYGFWPLVYARACIRLEFVLVHFVLMKHFIGIPVLKTLKNVMPAAISALVMGGIGFFLKQISDGLLWSLLTILICAIIYFSVLFLFPSMRRDICKLNKVKSNLMRNKQVVIVKDN